MKCILEINQLYSCRSLITFLCTLSLLCGCQGFRNDDKNYKSPPGYNLNKPNILKLPLELDEISGLAFYPKDTSIFAIQDERGWLYKIFLNHPGQIKKWKFADGADFEDLVLHDSVFYVLKSTGDVLAFRFFSADSLVLKQSRFQLADNSEFEILYYDKDLNKMVLICKDCETDKKKFLSTYVFNQDSLQFISSPFVVNVKNIAKMVGQKSIKFKPSAAAVNPITDELYIISSINKMLIVTDKRGEPKQVYMLNSAFFKQPEGIAFTDKGDLIISNEAADIGVANILIYPYNQISRK